MSSKKTIFWFRQDLRLHDNPGLYEAAQNGSVLPIYILDTSNDAHRTLGKASTWWLHHSLLSLNQSLNNTLNIYCDKTETVLTSLIKHYDIQAVYWNRCYEPFRISHDTEIKTMLKNMGVECKSFNGSLLWEPWEILKADKTAYKVYTPFYRNGCLKTKTPRKPLPQPTSLSGILDTTNKTTIDSLNLIDKKTLPNNFGIDWHIGEKAAQKKLTLFLETKINGYKEKRDYPGESNCSQLSPHLHFGEISPHQVWHETYTNISVKKIPPYDADHFLSELAWREFSYYLLYHFPNLPIKNFQPKFDAFPWVENINLLTAWQEGKTGYPIVDAGMRELKQTGFMHNRVRMIVASFLIKNLLIDWRHGENWFWNHLVDADLANNSASWQWVAGSGADAAPYFRIFNPVTQGEKFDKDGSYTRRFIPELKNISNKYLFKPWEAPSAILNAAGIILGTTYPKPIIDLASSRNKALQAFQSIKEIIT